VVAFVVGAGGRFQVAEGADVAVGCGRIEGDLREFRGKLEGSG
jgi:hypothetical protein